MKLTIVGRDPQVANLLINSQFVSSYHAEIIQLDNGDIYIVDKSSNGTFVEGVRIPRDKEVLVQRGQTVLFADAPLDWQKVDEIRIPGNVKQVLCIGSHFANDIKAIGNSVSRFHATLRQMNDGSWYICDYSKNGTTVNGKRIPRNNYVPLKAGDTIECAGVPVDNPIKKSIKWGWVAGVIAAVLVLAAAGFGIKKMKDGSVITYSDTELYNKYNSAVGLIYCGYHFEATCGTLDLADYDLPTQFIPEDFVDPTNTKKFSTSLATGFLIGEQGYVITNRHVAQPWEEYTGNGSEEESIIQYVEDAYRDAMTELINAGHRHLLPYVAQVKIKGVLDFIHFYPNNNFLDNNAINCDKISVTDENIDLALLKLRAKLPEDSKPLPLSIIATKKPESGQHICVIGYPGGTTMQSFEQNNLQKLQCLVNSGSVSNNNNRIWFGFDAASFSGASGSPIFDASGKLVGVNYQRFAETQGFNHAIQTEHLIDFLKANKVNN